MDARTRGTLDELCRPALTIASLVCVALLFVASQAAAGQPLTAKDRAEIQNTLATYSHLLNNHIVESLDLVFTKDTHHEYTNSSAGTIYPPVDGLDALAAVLLPVNTDHETLDSIIWRDSDGTVRAWSSYITHRPDGTVGHGEYLDILVNTQDGWRISVRHGNTRSLYGQQPREWYGEWWPTNAP